MAREHESPSFGPAAEMWAEIKRLRSEVNGLKSRTTATLQQIDVTNIDDPIEGEEVIDYADQHKHKWYSGGSWRTAGGFTTDYIRFTLTAPFTFGPGARFCPIGYAEATSDTLFEVGDFDFGSGAKPGIQVNQAGLYLCILDFMTFVVQPLTITANIQYSLSCKDAGGIHAGIGDVTLARLYSGNWTTVVGASTIPLTGSSWVFPVFTTAMTSVGVSAISTTIIRINPAIVTVLVGP
jgi:hypothetical protein